MRTLVLTSLEPMTDVPPTNSPEDSALVDDARAHDARADAAFRELFLRYKDEIFVFVLRILRDRGRAEDVLQEAFFRVHLNLEHYDRTRSFRAWLYQIARNAALDALRIREKEDRLVDEKARRAEPPPGEPVLPEVARREADDRTRSALATLPGETRALLIQRHGHDMKLEELAQSWSCNERTIRTRLAQAAEKLAHALLARRSPPIEGATS
jgi:RNA polymerase sigma-70 factor (ECF subfamily)